MGWPHNWLSLEGDESVAGADVAAVDERWPGHQPARSGLDLQYFDAARRGCSMKLLV